MKNKVTWVREESGFAVPYLYEQKTDNLNLYVWRRYNLSKCYKPDVGNFSKGLATFQEALKRNYEAVIGVHDFLP
jgi:hypothetical protein